MGSQHPAPLPCLHPSQNAPSITSPGPAPAALAQPLHPVGGIARVSHVPRFPQVHGDVSLLLGHAERG